MKTSEDARKVDMREVGCREDVEDKVEWKRMSYPYSGPLKGIKNMYFFYKVRLNFCLYSDKAKTTGAVELRCSSVTS